MVERKQILKDGRPMVCLFFCAQCVERVSVQITDEIRSDFPFFKNNPEVTYLDSSATSQIPSCVIERMNRYDLYEKASPYRGMYSGSVKATDDYEHARKLVKDFIHAKYAEEIIFTRNATESINLVAYSVQPMISPDDEILVGIAEHHSNMVPWQQLAKRTGATIRYLPVSKNGTYTTGTLILNLSPKTRLVALSQMSNVFGAVNDIKAIAEIVHRLNAILVVDGCQSVPHIPVDVTNLNVDFLAFSGHKMLAPMGIGVLYGRRAYLHAMQPFLTGGEMIEDVTTGGTTWAPLPQKFEAGTVNTGGAIALGEAISYYNRIGFEEMMHREGELTYRLMEGLSSIPHVKVIGSPESARHHGIVSFTVDGVHPHDVAAIMAEQGIAIRAGHHCAKPLHDFWGIGASCRVSVMFYNTEEEIDNFLKILPEIRGAMGYAD